MPRVRTHRECQASVGWLVLVANHQYLGCKRTSTLLARSRSRSLSLALALQSLANEFACMTLDCRIAAFDSIEEACHDRHSHRAAPQQSRVGSDRQLGGGLQSQLAVATGAVGGAYDDAQVHQIHGPQHLDHVQHGRRVDLDARGRLGDLARAPHSVRGYLLCAPPQPDSCLDGLQELDSVEHRESRAGARARGPGEQRSHHCRRVVTAVLVGRHQLGHDHHLRAQQPRRIERHRPVRSK